MLPAICSARSELWPRLPGIVGGLGPLAHIDMERHLVDAVMRRFTFRDEALTDQKYLPWVVASVPQTPDRTAALQNRGPSPLPGLLSALGILELCRCDFALIACNTAYAWIRQIREGNRLPILDFIEVTIQELRHVCGPDALIGLLATDGSLASGVYTTRAASIDQGPRFLSPPDLEEGHELQSMVMDCIYGRVNDEAGKHTGGIKSGIHLHDASAREDMERQLCLVIDRLVAKGAEAVVLGCTELSLLLNHEVIRRRLNRNIRLVDPMDVAARTVVRIAAGEEPLPR